MEVYVTSVKMGTIGVRSFPKIPKDEVNTDRINFTTIQREIQRSRAIKQLLDQERENLNIVEDHYGIFTDPSAILLSTAQILKMAAHVPSVLI